MWGIITLWVDTLASIPTNWLLCDGNNSTPNLLGKYLLSVGTGEDPGDTGGSTTHTHTSPAHGHTQDAHSHSGATGDVYGYGSWNSPTVAGGGLSRNHQHSVTLASSTATNQTTIVTINTASNEPPYYKIAPIIDSTSYGVKYPANSLIFWGQSTLPNGWFVCDGSNDTPDLRNKFLKCVDLTENPGATGGSATHIHTITAHTHTQDAHTHSGTTSSVDPSGTAIPFSGATTYSLGAHTHPVSVPNATATNQTASITMDTINGEPIFKKLLILKNAGVANRPKYAIVIWTGTLVNIPLGYVICDGNNGTPNLLEYFIKGANDSSELEDVGGSSVHNHTATSHTHTQDVHEHTPTYGVGNDSGYSRSNSGSSQPMIPYHHTHAVSQGGPFTFTSSNQATTITIDNSSFQANYPPYYKVAYIMQSREMDIGAYSFTVM